MEDFEKSLILKILQAHQWNREKAARELGITRNTLFKKIHKFGLVKVDKSRLRLALGQKVFNGVGAEAEQEHRNQTGRRSGSVLWPAFSSQNASLKTITG